MVIFSGELIRMRNREEIDASAHYILDSSADSPVYHMIQYNSFKFWFLFLFSFAFLCFATSADGRMSHLLFNFIRFILQTAYQSSRSSLTSSYVEQKSLEKNWRLKVLKGACAKVMSLIAGLFIKISLKSDESNNYLRIE